MNIRRGFTVHQNFKKQLNLISEDAIKQAAIDINVSKADALLAKSYDGSRMDVHGSTVVNTAIQSHIKRMESAYIVEANRRSLRSLDTLQRMMRDTLREIYGEARELLKDSRAYNTKRDLYRKIIDEEQASSLLRMNIFFDSTPLLPFYKRMTLLSWIVGVIFGAIIGVIINGLVGNVSPIK